MPRIVPAGWPLIALLAVAPAPAAAQGPASGPACQPEAVVMLSTSWCGYWRKARRFFNEHAIDFEEIDAERTPSESIRSTAKRNGVPYIIIGGAIVRGFNERRLRELLCVQS